jgi:hypothetical protein
MKISHQFRFGITGAVLALSGFLFAISAGASTSAVACQVTRWDASASRAPIATAGNLRVTVPALVFVTVDSGALDVSTNTGRPPTTSDRFYVIRSGRAGHAPAGVIDAVLRSCR